MSNVSYMAGGAMRSTEEKKLGTFFHNSHLYYLCVRSFILLGLWFLALLGAGPAHAHDPSPNPLNEVAFEQKLNERVPLDLIFEDETGKSVQLGDYFGEKPVILVFTYYGCKNLCGVVREELVESLQALEFDVGDEFEIVTVSINPGDTPALATAKKGAIMQHYARPEAAAGWHFLTGEDSSIDQLAEAVGFRYAYDAELDQYAHPAGIMVLTPQGRISRYFYGLDYLPTDLRLGLVEASANKIGSLVDQLLLRCYNYDPVTGKYTLVVMNVLRMAGVTTVLILGTFMFAMFRRERRKKRCLNDGCQFRQGYF